LPTGVYVILYFLSKGNTNIKEKKEIRDLLMSSSVDKEGKEEEK
jgi:hypothetical protein